MYFQSSSFFVSAFFQSSHCLGLIQTTQGGGGGVREGRADHHPWSQDPVREDLDRADDPDRRDHLLPRRGAAVLRRRGGDRRARRPTAAHRSWTHRRRPPPALTTLGALGTAGVWGGVGAGGLQRLHQLQGLQRVGQQQHRLGPAAVLVVGDDGPDDQPVDGLEDLPDDPLTGLSVDGLDGFGDLPDEPPEDVPDAGPPADAPGATPDDAAGSDEPPADVPGTEPPGGPPGTVTPGAAPAGAGPPNGVPPREGPPGSAEAFLKPFFAPFHPDQVPPCTCSGGRWTYDPAKLLPVAHLYLHVHQDTITAGNGVARWEGEGPISWAYVRDVLGPQARFVVKPVIDPATMPAVDAYEIPERLREGLHLRTPFDIFPYATNTSRRKQVDHNQPYPTRATTTPRRPARDQPRVGNRADRAAQPRRHDHLPPPGQDPRRLEGRAALPRDLRMDEPPRVGVRRRQHRHPPDPPTPGHGAAHHPACLGRGNGPRAPARRADERKPPDRALSQAHLRGRCLARYVRPEQPTRLER